MVFHFHPRGFEAGRDDWLIYMGRDKHENEDLIRYGFPTDVWFHVDNLSSAHNMLQSISVNGATQQIQHAASVTLMQGVAEAA